ncbi:hypothetical protein RJ640_007376 [Escallonia rubra]|uniref:Protein kinase domain-containing protein n=1 Tax=Escallonia rubra TaxID=112253 RepID=A0AA88QTE3_9ASTE|nr:hypothetical protein RJ640_007376 [Escallonia rubra]
MFTLGLLHVFHQIIPISAAAAAAAAGSPCLPSDRIAVDFSDLPGIQHSNRQEWSHQKEFYATTLSTDADHGSGKPKQFTYTVNQVFVMIRVHFFPISYSGLSLSNALFSVSAGPYTLLTTSDSSYSTNCRSSKYTVKEFCINLDSTKLDITVTPSNSTPAAYSLVNKIEVMSIPRNLYFKKNVDLPLVGHSFEFNMGNSTALEKMYRLNVGGKFISGEKDPGMLCDWLDDTPFLVTSSEATTTIHSNSRKISYGSKVPECTAPLEMYATARTIKPNSHRINLTWLFPVDSGFYYLVRLHFCEISWDVKAQVYNQRMFRVYVNHQIAKDNANVMQWADDKAGVAVYRDYIVDLSRYRQDAGNLLLELESKIGSNGSTLYLPILNGLEIFKLSGHSNNLSGQFPFCSQHSHRPASHVVVITNMARLFAFLILLAFAGFVVTHFPSEWYPPLLLLLLRYCKRDRRNFTMPWESSDHRRYFSIKEMSKATDNFSEANLIGHGGFGKVYKGYIDQGATTAAIKRGSPTSHQGLNEFQTEITILSQLRHRHIVSLIGYCTDKKEMILVYDFIARGTLRDHLYGTQKSHLPWKQRLKICIGAAQGLHYLHRGTKQTIIHRDVKTTNILLDERWVAKVADFGLSKYGPNMLSHTHVSTIVKGSFGYLDPEYYRHQKLTEKSDVYSFGVVLFEVLCGRPAVLPVVVDEEEDVQQANLAEWVLRSHQMGTLEQIIDPSLRGEVDPKCLKTFTEIGRQCLADKGKERPLMGDVVWNLELAWQQQNGDAEDGQETIRNGASENVGSADLAGINGCIGTSDPTPGTEFSEIITPKGR